MASVVSKHFNVECQRIRELSATTRDFRFVRSDGEPLDYEPGQFYRFIFTDSDGEFERSYSLCNFEDTAGSVMDLVVSRVEGGRATRLLFAAEKGLTASVSGPFGRLVLPPELPPRLILISTSVGIAPYLPMLKPLSQALQNSSLEVEFIFGVRDRSEFLYSDLLLKMAKDHANFQLSIQYSREIGALSSYEARGYVQSRLAELNPDPARDYVMLCGNPEMIDECYEFLKLHQFRPRQVRREKYVFAKDSSPAEKKSLTEDQKRLIAEKMKKYQR